MDTEQLKEDLEKALSPRSGQSVVVTSDNGDDTVSALYIRGSLLDGDVISCELDGRAFVDSVLGAVSDGTGISVACLKGDKFNDLIVDIVGASACSDHPFPGVSLRGYTSGPVVPPLQRFASEHGIGSINVVPDKLIRNISWRYHKATRPAKAAQRKLAQEDDLLF